MPVRPSPPDRPNLRRVLVANRGEIAIRIAKAAAALGMESVAVYPRADEFSLHIRLATRAVALGGAAAEANPVAAYLDIDALLAVAAETGCDCVHPGYGFLAENADFARRCAEAGLVFVGPSPEALALFGDKVRARALARSLNIPTAEGSTEPLPSAEVAAEMAAGIGYPVMLKAAAGGGGRGMRLVEGPDEMAEAFDRCRGEAEAAFGDGALFMERRIERPRHIEVQILGDGGGPGGGNVVHLWERDCSVQQRNQKVVEVAPADGLDPALRQRILGDAVRLVAAADFRGAGTVEFLVAPEQGAHYFIECNPRIQVEHTVTEQITGVDLVDAQFLLAGGATLADLGLGSQAEVPAPRGHAVQARVVAVGPGTITAYKEPAGPGTRVDGSGYAGYAPPPQFDPLLAKVIATSGSVASLASAVDRTRRALDEFHVAGLPTNLGQLRAILADESVRSGDARTTLLAERPELASPTGPPAGAPSGNGSAATTEPGSAPGPVPGAGPGAGLGSGGSGEGPGPATTPGPGAAVGTGSPTGGNGGLLALLDSRAAVLARGAGAAAVGTTAGGPSVGGGGAAGPSLSPGEGQRGVECPMDAVVIECPVEPGDRVTAGATIAVVSAMKMETNITAPAAGVIADLVALAPGTRVSAGQVVALLEADGVGQDDAGESTGSAQSTDTAGPWQPTLDQVDALHRLATERLAPGSTDPGVVRQRSRGKLTCRERIDLLLDDGTFREVGSVAGFASYGDDGTVEAFTPANHVGGWGDVDARPTVVCADDFTSRGGHSDGAIGAKSLYLDRLSIELAIPSVRLLDGSSGGGSVASMVPAQRSDGEKSAKESKGAIKAGRPRVSGGGGSFLPSHLGSTPYTRQLTTVPVVNVLLGSVVGIGAAKAVLGHFSVMVRDIAQLFVAGPPVVSHAMGYDITKEELGGWHIHCRNGSVDNLAETEEDALAQTRRFLSYLPGSVFEAPPSLPPRSTDPADRREEELAHLIPRKRTTTFDVRRVIELMADRDSFFEIGPLWGTDQVVGFARFNGRTLGVLASDSRHLNGGALTADGCAKLTRHLDLCDLFNIPVLNLVDNPGFAVGLEHEINGTIRKGGEWMVAFAQTSVPIFTVVMRRSFGVAGNNYASPRSGPSVRVTWPAADVGGIPPEGGIEAAYKRQLAEAEDPVAFRAELEARIESARGPLGPLSRFEMEEMIDPRDTRRHICEWVEQAYRLVSLPTNLGPRDLGFRP